MTKFSEVDRSTMISVLERTLPLGYEIAASGLPAMLGVHFTNHAPMASEALVEMGFSVNEVHAFLERSIAREKFFDEPEPKGQLAEDELVTALGDYTRVTDWYQYFHQQIERDGYSEVLSEWLPMLMPGALAALTHGLIRTMHATRTVHDAAQSGIKSPIFSIELSKGLAYWAAKFQRSKNERKIDPSAQNLDIDLELTKMIERNSEIYLSIQKNPFPLVHAITAPAAFRFMLPFIPVDQRVESFMQLDLAVNELVQQFKEDENSSADARIVSADELKASAFENSDEHAIKITEAAIREHALGTSSIVFAAAYHAVKIISV